MADNWAETTRTVSYEKAVEFQLNQQTGLLKPLAGSYKGGMTDKSVEITDRFSDLYADDINVRNGKTEFQDMTVERRWIHKPPRAAIHVPLDPDDEMATEIDLNAPIAVGIARGIRRYHDDKFLVGYYGPAYTGEQGLTAVPFKAANVIPADWGETAGTYTGLTLAKLRRIRYLFRTLLVDTQAEMPQMLITALEIDALLQIDQYINSRYNPDSQRRTSMVPMGEAGRQALQDGEPTPFLGINFIPAEITNPKAYKRANAAGLTTNASGHRRLPVFVPTGMAGRSWLEFEPHRDVRSDMNHSTQYSGYTCAEFARVHEDKCLIVECN